MSDAPQRPSSPGDVVRGVLVSRLLGVVGRSPEEPDRRRRRRRGRRGAGAGAASGGAAIAPVASPATKPGRSALGPLALGFFVIGIVTMIPFEYTATRIIGVTALFAFIVTGLFAIARPDFLGADE